MTTVSVNRIVPRVKTQLQSLKPLLVDRLIDRRAWSELRDLTACLPLLSGSIVEYHFGTTPRQLDYSLRIKTRDREHRRLFAHLENADQVDNLMGEDVYAFFEEWIRPGSVLDHDVETTWLEYDYRPRMAKYSPPSLFVRLEERLSLERRVDVLRKTLRTCRHPFEDSALRLITEKLRELPRDISLYYFGLMLGRAERDKLRVCLRGQSLSQVVDYASEQGVSTELLNLAKAWQAVTKNKKYIWNFDCSPAFSDSYSVELFPGDAEDWVNLAELLRTSGCCTPEEYEAITAWNHLKPLLSESSLVGTTSTNRQLTVCVPNHIKLKMDDNGRLNAKVYLYFGIVDSSILSF